LKSHPYNLNWVPSDALPGCRENGGNGTAKKKTAIRGKIKRPDSTSPLPPRKAMRLPKKAKGGEKIVGGDAIIAALSQKGPREESQENLGTLAPKEKSKKMLVIAGNGRK